MRSYEIVGRNLETGRKRKCRIRAASEAAARTNAEGQGLTDLAVTMLPEEPPTERQLKYASDLGIQIPPNVSLHELSDLISFRVDHDKPADARHHAFAQAYDIDCTRYVGKRKLYNMIFGKLCEVGRERDLVAWFTFRVSRELFSGKVDAPIDGPNHPAVQAIAELLSSDKAVIKSIKRYEGQSLVWFGEFSSPDGRFLIGGSNDTIAYKKCIAQLREKFEIQPKHRTTQLPVKRPGRLGEGTASKGKGCMSIFVVAMGGLALLVGTILFR